MKDFNPLKTRKEQGLNAVPSWLFSLSEQRVMLASFGLHEVTTYNERGVWSTPEKVKHSVADSPTLLNGIDVRGDRKGFEDGVNYVRSLDPSPDLDIVSQREKVKNESHIASKLKLVRVYQTRVK